MAQGLLYRLPLTLVMVLAFLFIYMGGTIGFKLGRRQKHRNPNLTRSTSEFIPSSTLGLLALILSFTFSMAVNRYDHRKGLVMREANAIGTAYLRTKLFESPVASELRTSLKAYLAIRLDLPETQSSNDTTVLQKKIWDQANALTHLRQGPVDSLLLQSLNELFDIQGERTFEDQDHVPDAVYFVILIIAAVGLGMVSFNSGFDGEGGFGKITFLTLLLALAFTLVQDLDRPRGGLVTISDQTLRSLQDSLRD